MAYASADETEPFVQEGEVSDTGQKSRKWGLVCLRRTLTVPFCFFLVSALSTCLCAFFYLAEPGLAYLASGPIGITVSIYGLRHMKQLIGLKGAVDDFAKKNIRMNKEVNQLKREVQKFKSACGELRGTQQRIRKANEVNKQNLLNFRTLQNRMDQLNLETTQQLESAMVKAVVVHGKWEEEMYKHQRALLHAVFDRFDMDCKKTDGLSERQYNRFIAELPNTYAMRFAKMGGFNKLSGGKLRIAYEDFSVALDIFAEMEATDCEIDFEFRDEEQVMPLPGNDKNDGFGTDIASGIQLSALGNAMLPVAEEKSLTMESSPPMIITDISPPTSPSLKKKRTVVITKRQYRSTVSVVSIRTSMSTAGNSPLKKWLNAGSNTPAALSPHNSSSPPGSPQFGFQNASAMGSLSMSPADSNASSTPKTPGLPRGTAKYALADNDLRIVDESFFALGSLQMDLLAKGPQTVRDPQVSFASNVGTPPVDDMDLTNRDMIWNRRTSEMIHDELASMNDEEITAFMEQLRRENAGR